MKNGTGVPNNPLGECSFKEKILSNSVDLRICTWFVLRHIKSAT